MKVKDFFTSKDKWLQGTFGESPAGRILDKGEVIFAKEHGIEVNKLCLLGAISYCYNEEERDKIIYRIIDSLQLNYSLKVNYITTWNDNPRRTFAEIRQLVEKLDI